LNCGFPEPRDLRQKKRWGKLRGKLGGEMTKTKDKNHLEAILITKQPSTKCHQIDVAA